MVGGYRIGAPDPRGCRAPHPQGPRIAKTVWRARRSRICRAIRCHVPRGQRAGADRASGVAVATLAVVVLCSLVGIGQGAPDGLYLLPLGLALFSATDAGHRRVALAAIAVIVGGIVLVELATDRTQFESIRSAVLSVGWLVASVVFGTETRSRRALLQAAEQRAIEAERIVEAESLRRAGEERIRIARELHDILAHRISLISV